MYGTIARMKAKPGAVESLKKLGKEFGTQPINGFVAQYVFQMDADPNALYLVAIFENKDAYQANAASPEQHARYEQFRALLATEPEWHDGEIVYPTS